MNNHTTIKIFGALLILLLGWLVYLVLADVAAGWEGEDAVRVSIYSEKKAVLNGHNVPDAVRRFGLNADAVVLNYSISGETPTLFGRHNFEQFDSFDTAYVGPFLFLMNPDAQTNYVDPAEAAAMAKRIANECPGCTLVGPQVTLNGAEWLEIFWSEFLAIGGDHTRFGASAVQLNDFDFFDDDVSGIRSDDDMKVAV